MCVRVSWLLRALLPVLALCLCLSAIPRPSVFFSLGEIGRCVFVFIARDAHELGLNEGDMVEVFARTEGWLYGRKRGGKAFGM